MPRSRGEAAMCGMPIVSTDNFDVKNYFQNNKSAILSNNPTELTTALRLLVKNETLRLELGLAAREVAIKNFHIKDYIRKINNVFTGL
jgi:glycosyltransferase involved in cell wall biosynthesis